MEFKYNVSNHMLKGYPIITKKGIVSPNGESSPFVWNGRLMRLELCDPSHGTDTNAVTHSLIRDRESGEVISRLAYGCYYNSLYVEGNTAYVLETVSGIDSFSGDTVKIFESHDLVNWSERILISNPGWRYFNTSLTKGAGCYMLALESDNPKHAGPHPFTIFFAKSYDMYSWEMLDYSLGFSQQRYMGGPVMRYSGGWYYLISVTTLPGSRFTNYIYRTKDFIDWKVGDYNPILMPSNEDRLISPYAADLTKEIIDELKTGYNCNNSDIDFCDYNSKTIINYNIGNQLGFYALAEAEYDGTVDEFLTAHFE